MEIMHLKHENWAQPRYQCSKDELSTRTNRARWDHLLPLNHRANSSNELQVVNIIALCMQSEIKTSEIHVGRSKSSKKGRRSKQSRELMSKQ